MNTRQFLAGGALAFGLAAASAAAAHGAGGFVCQTFNMAKAAPPATHCVTWSHEARAMMQAAPCDPAKASAAEMRARCGELSADTSRPTPAVHG